MLLAIEREVCAMCVLLLGESNNARMSENTNLLLSFFLRQPSVHSMCCVWLKQSNAYTILCTLYSINFDFIIETIYCGCDLCNVPNGDGDQTKKDKKTMELLL